MPIQFNCQQCGKTLSVADEHAGKSASCPDCKTVMKIPDGNDFSSGKHHFSFEANLQKMRQYE
jgi:phage FluMu protein Com